MLRLKLFISISLLAFSCSFAGKTISINKPEESKRLRLEAKSKNGDSSITLDFRSNIYGGVNNVVLVPFDVEDMENISIAPQDSGSQVLEQNDRFELKAVQPSSKSPMRRAVFTITNNTNEDIDILYTASKKDDDELLTKVNYVVESATRTITYTVVRSAQALGRVIVYIYDNYSSKVVDTVSYAADKIITNVYSMTNTAV